MAVKDRSRVSTKGVFVYVYICMYVCMYVCILACMDCECAWNCGNCVIPKNHDIGDFEAKKLLAK